MNCLKCGAEVAEGHSFCEKCLGNMEKQPVLQNIAVVIPRREYQARKSVGKKRSISVEEKLTQTRAQLHKCLILAGVLSVLVLILFSACVYFMTQRKQPTLGQNYSTVGSTSPTDPLPTE